MSTKNKFLKNLYQNEEYFKKRAGKEYDKLLEVFDEADLDFWDVIKDKRANEYIKDYSTQEMLNRIERKNNGLPPLPMTPNPYKKLAIRNKLGMVTPQQYIKSGNFASKNGRNPYQTQSVNVNKLRSKRQRSTEDGNRNQYSLKKSVIDGHTKRERRNHPQNDSLVAISGEFYLKPHHQNTYSSKTLNPFALKKDNFEFEGRRKINMNGKPNRDLHRSMRELSPQEKRSSMQRINSKDKRISFKDEQNHSKKRLRKNANDDYEPDGRYGKYTVTRPYDGNPKKYYSNSQNPAMIKRVGSREQNSSEENKRHYKYPNSKNFQIAKRNLV